MGWVVRGGGTCGVGGKGRYMFYFVLFNSCIPIDQPSRVIGVQFMGQMVGELIPRCSDPVLKIRQTSIESVQILLKVTTCTTGL